MQWPRGPAAAGPSPGDPTAPVAARSATLTESIPSSATPRRMNGKTVVSSFAPAGIAAMAATAAPVFSVRSTYGSVAAPTASTAPAQRSDSSGRPSRGHLVPGQDPGRAQRPQSVRLVGLAGRRPDLVAAVGQDRQRRAPRPRRMRRSPAPARHPGVSPRSSRATTDIAAVNPAVPIDIASRGDRPGASGTTQPGRHALVLAVPAVARHAQLVAVGEHGRADGDRRIVELATTSPARSMPGDERADPGDLAVGRASRARPCSSRSTSRPGSRPRPAAGPPRGTRARRARPVIDASRRRRPGTSAGWRTSRSSPYVATTLTL